MGDQGEESDFQSVVIDFAKAFHLVNIVALLQALICQIWHRCDLYLMDVVAELYRGDCTDIGLAIQLIKGLRDK